MEVYLSRHGDAVGESVDHRRPLSPHGRDQVERVARWAAGAGIEPARIDHSDKLRAEQTAQIYGEALGGGLPIAVSPGLLPMDDPGRTCESIARLLEPVLIVGHLPHLAWLASLLMHGSRPRTSMLEVGTATLICLEGEGEDWKLKWMLRPEIIPA